MEKESLNANRLRIVVGTVTFEIEGSEELIRDGLSYAKENLLVDPIPESAPELIPPREIALQNPEAPLPSLRDFYGQRNPSSDMERVTVLAYYAREYRGMSEVSESNLRPLFNEVGTRLPKDLSQAMRNAARKDKGWIEYTGNKGYYRITNAGINLVNLGLSRSK